MPDSIYTAYKETAENNLLDTNNYDEVRAYLSDKIVNAVKNNFTAENDRYILKADNIKTHWKDYVPKDEKEAILSGADLKNRVTGKVSLIDKATGETVDQTGNITLVHLPYLTERGEYVRRGTRYTFPQQLRTSAGVYVRKTDSGNIEAAFNVKPGTGSNFRIDFDPDKATYYYKVGQRRIPAVFLLEQMGVDEDTIKNSIGEEIYNQNKTLRPSPQAVHWMNKLKEDNTDSDNPLRDYFAKMQLNTRTTQRTLGKSFENLTPEAVLTAMSKINNVYWDKADTDDRDSLAYQHVFDLGDMVAERISSDKGRILNNFLWKASNRGNLKNIPSGILNKHIDALFNDSGLAQAVEEISPLDAYVQNQRVVKLGPGAIPSVQQAPLESRAVQPSYLGFIDPVKAPESMRVGLDMYLAENVRRGKQDGLLYTQFFNPKTGKAEWVSSDTASNSVIAFPEFIHSDKKFIPAIINGQDTQYVDRDEVDFVVPTGDELTTSAVNMIPLKQGIKGMRVLMGSKYSSQALPLHDAEAPLVETILRQPDDSEVPITTKLGKYMGARKSPVGGTVKAVRKDRIVIEDRNGNTHNVHLYQNLPLARKTVLHNTPTVKAGDKVEKDTLLATSNFTSKDGKAAPGKNLSVAYTNYLGSTFEDAIVISESAADKLSHTGLYQENISKDDKLEHNKQRYSTLFPSHFSKQQLDKLDDKGVIKPGKQVKFGDPLIVAVKDNAPELSKLGRRSTIAQEVTWDHHTPGVVTDIAETDKGYKVFVKAKNKMQVADKLAILQGGKGVVAKIVPDDQMLQDSKGNPVDVIINRITLPSRTNTSQMHAAALGKIAKKRGEAYQIPGFIVGDSLNSFVKKELRKHNVKTNEDLYDPRSGKTIPNIFTGVTYFVKTQQTAESKGKGRGVDFYTTEGEPGRGGSTGAKHMGTMEYEALLGHQAKNLIKDTKLIRGQKNDDFWRDVRAGRTPTMPQVPLVYEKLKDTIRAAGVNYDTDTKKDSIFAMTNEDVKKLTGNRELSNASTYKQDMITPIEGGLFDRKLTDSAVTGTRWSYFSAPEPMLSPIMHAPIRTILGLTKKDLAGYLSGNKEYNGKRGGHALKQMLADINIDNLINDQKEIIRSGTKSKLDKAVKTYKYLNAMKKNNVKPADFMLDRIPVLPPKYRPIQKIEGITMVNDMNYMYRELYNSMQDFKDAVSNDLPEEDINEARIRMNKNFISAVGLSEPENRKLQEKQIGGILQQLFGKKSAKASLVQRKVLGSNLDLSGLASISPNPALKLNEVGLPINNAWEVYEPFVVQHLIKNNVPATQAAKIVQKRDKQALNALQKVVKQRPVIVNRAPSLHKYSLVAMWPKLIPGDNIQIPPQLVSPLGADFDGDTMSFTVPVSKQATEEAITKMMPDKNLISESTGDPLWVPADEYAEGLYYMSKEPAEQEPVYFESREDMLKAYRAGDIRIDTPVIIK